jgi:hypothetical protein
MATPRAAYSIDAQNNLVIAANDFVLVRWLVM